MAEQIHAYVITPPRQGGCDTKQHWYTSSTSTNIPTVGHGSCLVIVSHEMEYAWLSWPFCEVLSTIMKCSATEYFRRYSLRCRKGTAWSKLAAIQLFLPVHVGIELPVWSSLIKSVLQGISRSHTLRAQAHVFGSLYREMY